MIFVHVNHGLSSTFVQYAKYSCKIFATFNMQLWLKCVTTRTITQRAKEIKPNIHGTGAGRVLQNSDNKKREQADDF